MAQDTQDPKQQDNESVDPFRDELDRLPGITGPLPRGSVYDRPGHEARDQPSAPNKPPGDEAEQDEESSLYRATGQGGSGGENVVGRGYQKQAQPRSMARRVFGIRRKMFILSTFSFAFILPIIILLAFLFPSLKIPQLAAEIEGYRLARLTRTFYKQAAILNADRAAMDFNPNATTADLVGKTPLGKTWSLFKPAKVIANMKANGIVSYDYSTTGLNTQKLNAIVYKFSDGTTTTVVPPEFKYSLKPSDLVNNYKDRLRFAAQNQAALNRVLDGSNFFTRTRVGRAYQLANGAHLYWWERAGLAFKGKTQQESDILQTRLAEQRIAQPPNSSLHTGQLQSEVDKNKKILDACFKDDACTLDAAKNNGIPAALKDSLNKVVVSPNAALNFVNPLYAVLFPVCIAYDASNNVATQFFNAQNQAAVRTFMAVASADAQQRKGGVTAEAVGALGRAAGNTNDSIPAKAASGQSVDTSNEISPQAGPSGEFTVLNAFDKLLGGSGNNTTSHAANFVADKVCVITDPKIAAGLALANLLVALDPFTGPEELTGAETAGQSLAKTIGLKVASAIKGKVTYNAVKNTASNFAVTEAASQGLTYLSRMLILSQIGSYINGMDKTDFANQADMGAVAYNSQMTQQQTFGRPLTAAETSKVEKRDVAFANQQIEGMSTYQKTLALKNPYSLAGKLAASAGSIHTSNIASLFTNLPRLFASIFSPATKLFNHGVLADSPNADYGIVQFGWSTDEEDLIDSDPTYDPLVNAKIVQDSGQTASIAQKYAKCFGYTSDGQGNLTYDSTKQIGNLIGGPTPAIARDDNGNVIDSGDCSPNKLGPNNNEFGPQMVFRWRLDQSYRNTMTSLTDVQNAQ
jgi:hypothetical protein